MGDADAVLLSATGLRIERRAPAAALNLRGRPEDSRFVQAVTTLAGVAPPLAANTAATGLLATLLWLGPDEWLMLSETQSGPELAQQARAGFRSLRGAAVTDVTDARVVFTLAGPRAREVLAQGTGIDLHPRAFGPGRVAQTLLAKAGVILHQRDPAPTFDLFVARSFAGYAGDWLVNASGVQG